MNKRQMKKDFTRERELFELERDMNHRYISYLKMENTKQEDELIETCSDFYKTRCELSKLKERLLLSETNENFYYDKDTRNKEVISNQVEIIHGLQIKLGELEVVSKKKKWGGLLW